MARVLESIAGLLSAGLLVLALLLTGLLVAAPALVGGSGTTAATGPAIDRVLVQLAMGVAGELLHRYRTALPPRVRPGVAGLVIGGVLISLWWGWWR